MSKFLKVMGILCIVFGAIGVISMLSVLAVAGFISMAGVAIPVASLVIGLIQAILMIAAGIFGIRASSDQSKSGLAVIFGIILVVLAIISMCLGIAVAGGAGVNWTNFTGLIIPALYFVAAFLFKRKG